MEDTQYRDSFTLGFKQHNVRESIGESCPQFLMDSTKGLRPARYRRDQITNRPPETVSEIDGDAHRITLPHSQGLPQRSGSYRRVLAIDASPKLVIVDGNRRIGFQLGGSA